MMQLFSQAYRENETIPSSYTGDGEDKSPPLHWEDVPDGTREFALMMVDPDAPRKEPWVHWLAYHIPAEARDLPEGVERRDRIDFLNGAKQGVNSWSENNIGYRGPAPPPGHGPHRYFLTLFALAKPLQLDAGADLDALTEAIDNSEVLDRATLMGTYQR